MVRITVDFGHMDKDREKTLRDLVMTNVIRTLAENGGEVKRYTADTLVHIPRSAVALDVQDFLQRK